MGLANVVNAACRDLRWARARHANQNGIDWDRVIKQLNKDVIAANDFLPDDKQVCLTAVMLRAQGSGTSSQWWWLFIVIVMQMLLTFASNKDQQCMYVVATFVCSTWDKQSALACASTLIYECSHMAGYTMQRCIAAMSCLCAGWNVPKWCQRAYVAPFWFKCVQPLHDKDGHSV